MVSRCNGVRSANACRGRRGRGTRSCGGRCGACSTSMTAPGSPSMTSHRASPQESKGLFCFKVLNLNLLVRSINWTQTFEELLIEFVSVCSSDSQEFFDCYPAVQAAFHYAKLFSTGGEDEEEEEGGNNKNEQENEKKDKNIGKYLELKEFQTFFFALRQYFCFCQVKTLKS